MLPLKLSDLIRVWLANCHYDSVGHALPCQAPHHKEHKELIYYGIGWGWGKFM